MLDPNVLKVKLKTGRNFNELISIMEIGSVDNFRRINQNTKWSHKVMSFLKGTRFKLSWPIVVNRVMINQMVADIVGYTLRKKYLKQIHSQFRMKNKAAHSGGITSFWNDLRFLFGKNQTESWSKTRFVTLTTNV